MTLQYSDYDNIRDATHGLYAALDADDKAKINELWKGRAVWHKEIDDAVGANVVPEHTILRHDQRIKVTGGWFLPRTIGTIANNVDYKYFHIYWRDSVTAAQTIITSHPIIVANGNITQWIPYRINNTAPSANWIVPAGSTVTIETTRTPGGTMLIGSGLIVVEYELF